MFERVLRRVPGTITRRFSRSECSQLGTISQAQKLAVGEFWEKHAIFKASDVQTFINISGDKNPIHTSSTAAKGRGFQNCIVPGMLCASLFPAIIGSAFPGALYMAQDLKFRHPSLVGESILARVTLTAKSGSRWRFRTECFGPNTEILVDGTAIAIIQGHASEL